MKLHLNRPLVFFDIEATGLNITTDRIVEISYYKVFPNGNAEGKTLRVRPTVIRHLSDPFGKPMVEETTMHIPEASTAIHGITDEDVKDCPTFRQMARDLAEVLKDSDLAGYNSNHFDIPILAEEFLRAGVAIDLKRKNMVDAYTIFTKNEQRNLSAAYRFYCGKDLENAHSANADTMATYEVLMAQLERYDLPDTVEGLSEYSSGSMRFADFAGRIAYDKDGYEIFNFGQHKGRRVADVFRRDKGYYGWIIGGDFPAYTKQVCTRIFLENK
ncbi:MAG: exonuclease domain-containing protein [Paludibacteraceae bacterium]